MRNSPTPSACAAAAARAPAPSCTLASTWTACPSLVRAGPAYPASASAATRAAVDPGLGLGRVGVDGDRALLAVEQHGRPGRDVVEPADRDDAGQPELAGDDRGVAGRAAEPGGQPDDAGRVEPGGVGRGEVVGEQHRRHLGARDARLALAGQLRHDPVADVAHVGDPLGHEPAERGEHVHELLRGLDGRRPRRATPPSIRCSAVDRRPRSRAMPAVVASTSALTPVAAAARCGQPPGHDSAAAANRSFSAARPSSGTVAAVASSGSRTAPDGPDRPGRGPRRAPRACR